ncbi:MAG: GGDEF domain-containing protein [Fibrobacter sp.]|nr:GGDEF domain-containing protein [Fibrobacter sp.]
MTIFSFILWLIAFVAGVAVAFFVPETTITLSGKFFFIGAWGVVLGFVLYSACKRKIENKQIEFDETLNELKASKMEITSSNPVVSEPVPPAILPDLPKGAMSAKEALEKMAPEMIKAEFPMEAWKAYAKSVLKNRPFPEVLKTMEALLPKLFANASGILYMYAGSQTDLHKILSFGDKVISDDVIRPGECASFNAGDIVVSDYSSPDLKGGCTHLHHHPKGISFCAPIEGIDEHFGIFSLQTDTLPDNESKEDWLVKVNVLATTFGLYIANQNLNMRFEQNSIRDSLTGLFNRRYAEESLTREVFSAIRHKNPIGLIMIYPDAAQEIKRVRGRHAVDQLLWELGQRLPGYIRNEDIPCRYDGDVFCIILPGADLQITRQRAEKIRNEMAQLQIAYGDGILSTTLSMGVSVMPVHAVDAPSLFYAAHASMKYAIRLGSNRVVLADALVNKE